MEIIEIIGITALVVIVVFVIGIIIYGELYGKKAVVKRKLEKTVSKRISEFKDGEVSKFIGNIEIIDPLLAPISGKECSYYYINIEERVRVNSGSKTWETIIEEELSNKLLIKDGNKYAYINDKGELKHEQHILVKATGFKLNEEKNVVYRFKINLHTINENNGSI